MMRRLRVPVALVAGIGVALILALSVAPPGAVPRGWLLAFSVWSSIPVGSMTLLLIHRLTGGAWGEALAPVLQPTCALLPLVALAFLPVLFTLPALYPWAADPAAVPADVARLYLNAPFFALRAVIALAGWSVFGVVLAAGGGGRLFAALGLAFHGLVISLVAVDWYLSLTPNYTASAFAMMIAVQQMLAALAFAALIGTPALLDKVAGDVGGLLIATLLGVVYLEAMNYLIAWYGDQPDKATWYLARGGAGWTTVLSLTLLLGALLPFAMLLARVLRRSALGLRMVGVLVLLGTALHFVWLLLPSARNPGLAIATGAIGLVAMALVSGLIGAALPIRGGAHAG